MIDAWHIYLTGTAVQVRRTSGLWRRHTEALPPMAWHAREPASLSLDALTPVRRGATLSVTVGSALAKFAIVTLPADLRDRDERSAAAAAHLQRSVGLQASDWACTLAQPSADGKVVVCAVRSALLARLKALAQEKAIRLVSVAPYAGTVWNSFVHVTVAPSHLCVVEEDAFTMLGGDDAGIDTVSAFGHEQQAGLLEREMQRHALAIQGDTPRATWLALPDRLAGMVGAICTAHRLTRDSGNLRTTLYPDFRDLAYCSASMP